MSTAEPDEVVVEPGGSIHVPPDQVPRLRLRPGEHLRLIRGDRQQVSRRSVRGLGVGQVAPEDVLGWEDFEAAHDANVKAAQVKYGS